MNVILLNGSPRKGWNTHKLLENVMKGAADAGAETELIHLYDYEYKGCISCFACKLKNSKTDGVCAVRDALRPVLEKCKEADAIIIGSPIYFDYPTAQCRAFMERLMFPWSAYKYDKKTGQAGTSLLERTVPTGLIYTMNTPEDWLEKRNYPTILNINEDYMRTTFGSCETLWSCDTFQFSKYDRYDIETFSEEAKAKHRDEQFPVDLQKAYELGARLVKLAKEYEGKER